MTKRVEVELVQSHYLSFCEWKSNSRVMAGSRGLMSVEVSVESVSDALTAELSRDCCRTRTIGHMAMILYVLKPDARLVAGVWPIDGRLDVADSDLPYLGGGSWE